MFPRLRTVAILMLLAGLALGVFTSRALRALGPDDERPTGALRGQPGIEYRVELYRRDLHLTTDQTNRLRQVLYRFDRRVRAKLWELRQAHAAEFRALHDEANTGIAAIVAEARAGAEAPPPAGTPSEEPK